MTAPTFTKERLESIIEARSAAGDYYNQDIRDLAAFALTQIDSAEKTEALIETFKVFLKEEKDSRAAALVTAARMMKERDEARRELAEAEEAIRLAADEISWDGVTFSDERVSYVELQVTRGFIDEFASHPAVPRALERGG